MKLSQTAAGEEKLGQTTSPLTLFLTPMLTAYVPWRSELVIKGTYIHSGFEPGTFPTQYCPLLGGDGVYSIVVMSQRTDASVMRVIL